MQLTISEARVLGSLIEKEITTPEYYPLSLNALLNACNQKSSREPVLQLTEPEVRNAVRALEDKDLVAVDHGSRVERYENRARTVFQLRRDETAVLCLLLLRGPQTPGELRSRADRLFTFDDISAVMSALQRLSTPQPELPGRQSPLTAALPRQLGSREQRFTQLLSENAPAAPEGSFSQPTLQMPDRQGTAVEVSPASSHPDHDEANKNLRERTAQLEVQVARLEIRLASLERQLGVAPMPEDKSIL